MKIKMKNDFILLKDLPNDDSIIITTGKYNRKCEVIAVSEDSELNVGDVIFKNVGRGTEMNLDGEIYEMLHINFIMCKITE